MLRVFEAFSGIGTQRMALRNLGIEYEVVAISEIDKEALLSYSAIHCDMTDEVINSYDKYPCREEIADWLSKMNIGYDFKNNEPYDWHKHITQNNNLLEKHYLASRLSKNLGDISKIATEDIPEHDLFTYSFPCQDISVAGKGKGFEPGSGTRSSLLWECEKIIEAKRPKYLLMENVKALIFKKFKPGFEKWLRLLEELGYTNYWQVLNAKDYGIPQNRERVFCVSILGTHEPYVFPKKQELILRLKDVLEDEVDERFYINNERADKLIKQLVDKKHTELPCIFDDRDKGFGVKIQDICPTQRAERNGIKCIGVDYRIRKLTPKECWRLMGISDEDFEKAQKMNSNTQLYKQAGNAIVVDVLEGIFSKLFLSKK